MSTEVERLLHDIGRDAVRPWSYSRPSRTRLLPAAVVAVVAMIMVALHH